MDDLIESGIDNLFCVRKKMYPAGRFDKALSVGISKTLELAGFRLGRLKTGRREKLSINIECILKTMIL